MTITSIDLAMDNYTQVEKIGAKSAVHVLAVLKPSRVNRERNNSGLQPYYKEITYPLDAGVPPNSDYYQPTDMPRTKIYSHARQSEPDETPVGPVSEGSGKTTDQSIQGPDGTRSEENSSEANGTTYATQMPQSTNRLTPFTKERLSERDRQATRTFAILQMLDVGSNPWDLGSRLLNFKTVMGTSLLDWFLPIRRSPCCNNEDAQSEYALGPEVDLLKSSVGFIAPQETNTARRRRRRKSTHPKRTGDSIETTAQTTEPNGTFNQPRSSIPLQNFNDAPTPHSL